MEKEISKGLKITFFIHFILGILLGIIFLFFPQLYCNLFGLLIIDTGLLRVIGAASLAIGFSSFLAYKNPDWEKVKLIIWMEFVWLIFATIAMLWWILAEGGPIAGWVVIVMFLIFLITFGYFYLQERR